jgi:hypothetical protein
MASTYSMSSAGGGLKLKTAEKRPSLPTSTPAPGLNGRPNPYASAWEHAPPPPKRLDVSQIPAVSASDLTINANRLVLERIACKLPYDVRETVMSIVNASMATAEHSLKQHEASQIELHALRDEVKIKTSEIDILYKRIDKYRDKLKLRDEVIVTLEEDDRHHRVQHDKGVKSMMRLAKTNRVLLDAFEALSGSPTKRKATANSDKRRRQPAATIEDYRPISTGSEFARTNSGLQLDDVNEGEEFNPQDLSDAQSNDHQSGGKIRASLLRMARDYNKMVKNVDLLQTENELLTTNLKQSEKRNRQMQLELEELRENNSISSAGSNAMAAARPDSPEDGGPPKKERHDKRRSSTLEEVDSRLAELVEKKAFDAMEGIKQMRLIVQHMAHVPSSLQQDEVAPHLCSAAVCNLFEVEAISVFILQPGGELVRKYTSRSDKCVTYSLSASKGVAIQVLRSGKTIKVNSQKSKQFKALDISVDACEGVYTKKVLCMPLTDSSNTRTIGSIQLINKHQNYKFSEVDELFCAMFSELAGTIISSVLLFNRVWDRSQTLTNILAASTNVFTAMPDSRALTSTFPLAVDQVLLAMEDVCRRTLHCAKAKAFVASEVIGLEEGSLVMLDADYSDANEKFLKRKQNKSEAFVVVAGMPGIAGRVMASRTPYMMIDHNNDPLHNPQVDASFESSGVKAPMYCVPLITLDGVVLGCIQVVRGPKSPALERTQSTVLTGRVLFDAAAQWTAYMLSPPLEHILKRVGSPCSLPRYLPQDLEPMQRINPATLSLKVHEASPRPGESLSADHAAAVDSEDLEGLDRHLGSDPRAAREVYHNTQSSDILDEDESPALNGASNSSSGMALTRAQLGTGSSAGKASGTKLSPLSEHAASGAFSSGVFSARPKSSDGKEAVQVQLLQEEIRNLKQTIGRLSTVDLNSLKADKKTPQKRIDSTLSMFSEEDLNVDGELKAMKEEMELTKIENERLRSEFESLKELYAAKPTGISSLSVEEYHALEDKIKKEIASDLSRQHTAELSHLKADLIKKLAAEHQDSLKKELSEKQKLFDARLSEQDRLIAAKSVENEELRKIVEDLRKQHDESDAKIHNLRLSMQALSSALEEERGKRPKSNPSSSQRQELKGASESDLNKAGGEVNSSPRQQTPAHTEAAIPDSPRYDDWGRFIDENGYTYYHNYKTGETSWDPPPGFPHHQSDKFHSQKYPGSENIEAQEDIGEAAEEPVRVGDWVQEMDSESGAAYWRNELSGATVWELPGESNAEQNEAHEEQSEHYHNPQSLSAKIDYGSATAGDYRIDL